MRNLRSYLVFLCIVILTGVMVDLPGALGSLTRLAQWPALIVWSICILFERKLRKPHPFHWAMLCFIAWNLITVFWSDDVSGTLRYCSRYIIAFLVSLMMWDVYRTKAASSTATWAFIIGCYVIVALTLVNSIHAERTAYDPFHDRYSAGDLNPNDLGIILAIGIPLAWRGVLAATTSSRAGRMLSFLFPFVAALGIVMSATRGGLVATIPGIAYLAFSSRQLSPKWRMILAFVIVVCLIGGVRLLALHRMSSQIARLTTSTSALSASGDGLDGRVGIWRAGLVVFEKNPIFGIGAGAFPEATRSFMDGVSPTGEPLVAHNTYLSILVETGLIGFALFLCVMGSLIKSIVRYQGQDKGAWIAALAAWLLGVLSLTFEYRPQTWLLFTLILIGTQQFERASVRTAEATPPAPKRWRYSRGYGTPSLPSKVS